MNAVLEVSLRQKEISMDEETRKIQALNEAAEWVTRALDEMNAAIREGNIQRISVANDRVEQRSSSMKKELRRLANFNEV
jgi:hypothetical protein